MPTPHFLIIEVQRSEWRWEFRDTDGDLAARSDKTYPGEQHCRDAISTLRATTQILVQVLESPEGSV